MEYLCYADGVLIADKIKIANSFQSRLVGLLSKKSIDDGEGLLLRKCSSIHTNFMKFAIDVVYLSDSYKVLFISSNLRPWRMGANIKKCKHILELKSGTATSLKALLGKHITIIPKGEQSCK